MSRHEAMHLSADDMHLLAALLEQRSPDELLIAKLLDHPVCQHHASAQPAHRLHHSLRAAGVSLAVAGALALAVTGTAMTPRVAQAQANVRAPASQVSVIKAKTENTALLAALLSSPTLCQGNRASVDQALAERPLAAGTALLIPAASAINAAPAQQGTLYTVQPGDTLSSISLRYYGNANFWASIYNANTNVVSNANWIYPGQQLAIPSTGGVVTPPPQTGQGPGGYTVVSGDTLSGIAVKAYGNAGRWYDIYRANTNIIADPNMIYPGQQLVIPS